MHGVLVLGCGLLGLLIGSFLNVVIWRVPQKLSVVRPPSHCPQCETPIRPVDNVPVLSWLPLHGKCPHCGDPIAARFSLGLSLGSLGWGPVFLGGFLAFLLGALVGVGLIATGIKGRKDFVPFGPFLALGTLITILWGSPILRWYTGS